MWLNLPYLWVVSVAKTVLVGAELWSFGPLPAKTDEMEKAVATIENFIVGRGIDLERKKERKKKTEKKKVK